MSDFAHFEKTIGYTFNDKVLLAQAFTHRSYVNENRAKAREHNERLEFLGDAVMELVVTDFLFHKYPKKPEGELTAYRSALVNTVTIASVADELSMNEFLLLSKGEARDTGRARQYILANTFEAVIGALYLDGGYTQAHAFLKQYLLPKIEAVIRDESWKDAKSRFQEVAQEKVGVTPNYETLKEEGPDHDKEFHVGVFLDAVKIAEGSGRSKQEAEQEAANNALIAKRW